MSGEANPFVPRGSSPTSLDKAATAVPARLAIASKMSPVADNPASTPVFDGWIDPGTTPQTPGMSEVASANRHNAGRGSDHVDDIARPATRTDSIPVRIERARQESESPARRPSRDAHSAESSPAMLSEVQ